MSLEDVRSEGVAAKGWLSGLRVLDLTDHRGTLAGHMLAQLGADVIQLEPPGGSSARYQAPFHPDWPEGENSLYWAAYGAGKRSVLCDPATPDGLGLFDRLIARADVLLESFAPGDGRPDWIAPERLAKLNPQLVHVSVTPFGLTGPRADWADSEIVLWAACGPLLLTRDLDDKPLRISVPQAWLHGAGDAAGAALIALFARASGAGGQHVDISVHQCVPQATLSAVLADAIGHADFTPRPPPPGRDTGTGGVDLSGSGSRTRRSKWPVRDGLAEMHLGIGPTAGTSTNQLFGWMRDENALPPAFADWDWTKLHLQMAAGEISEADLDAARAAVAAFLSTRSKTELMEIAIRRGVRIAPVDTIADLTASAQFAARTFFQTVRGPFGDYKLPGAFAMGSDGGFVPVRPAPRLGQDGRQVLAQWLGEISPSAARFSAPASVKPAQKDVRPFAGLKVLDLAWVVAGPLIGRTLADFGATVVRVDSPQRTETARLMGPFPGGVIDPSQSTLYENCNAGKLGLSLDLRTETARDVVRDLVAWADLAVESFTPGQMVKWGLGYEALAEINPRLVLVSTSLMGQSGPWSSFSGYGNHGAAIAGFQNIVGQRGQTPVGPFGPYTDFVAPKFGLTATLAALEHQRLTGRGCHLDVSQSEAGVQFLAPQIADYSLTGRVQTCEGNRDPQMAPHGVFRAQAWDSYIALACRNDRDWLALADLIGGSTLCEDPRFGSLAARKANEDALDAIVSDWCLLQPVADIEARLQAIGVPAYRAIDSRDYTNDPQLAARNQLIWRDHPLMGRAVFEASHFGLMGTPPVYRSAAPVYGQHNEQVLRDLLGYDDEKIHRIVQNGGIS